jgi:hypothetical protein
MASSDTPPPVASPLSAPSPLPKSGLDSFLEKLPGTSVQLYTVHRLSLALLESLRAPSADDRWRWALLGTIVVVVLPAAASSLFGLFDRFLSSKRT